MLESLFIFMCAIAFVTFILGIQEENIVYTFMSLILWMIVMAAAHYIEVPTATDAYSDLGFSAFCTAFIFANVIWLFIMYMDFKERNKLP